VEHLFEVLAVHKSYFFETISSFKVTNIKSIEFTNLDSLVNLTEIQTSAFWFSSGFFSSLSSERKCINV
jgi:hypothetical protein